MEPNEILYVQYYLTAIPFSGSLSNVGVAIVWVGGDYLIRILWSDQHYLVGQCKPIANLAISNSTSRLCHYNCTIFYTIMLIFLLPSEALKHMHMSVTLRNVGDCSRFRHTGFWLAAWIYLFYFFLSHGLCGIFNLEDRWVSMWFLQGSHGVSSSALLGMACCINTQLHVAYMSLAIWMMFA